MTLVQALAIEDQLYQLLTLVLLLIGIGLEIYQWFREPQEWYWIVPTLTWMIHGCIFYLVLTLDRYTEWAITVPFGSYTIWSSLLRLHIIGVFVILRLFRVIQMDLRKRKKELENELMILKGVEQSRHISIEKSEFGREK